MAESDQEENHKPLLHIMVCTYSPSYSEAEARVQGQTAQISDELTQFLESQKPGILV